MRFRIPVCCECAFLLITGFTYVCVCVCTCVHVSMWDVFMLNTVCIIYGAHHRSHVYILLHKRKWNMAGYYTSEHMYFASQTQGKTLPTSVTSVITVLLFTECVYYPLLPASLYIVSCICGI